MKIHGQKPPRATKLVEISDNLKFTIQAVLDGGQFEKLCPMPQPPIRTYKNGEVEKNVNDPTYKQAVNDYATQQTHYIILRALEASDNDIVWDKVKLEDPTTWFEVENELKEVLTTIQYGQLVNEIFKLNSLNQGSL